uniref:Alpha-glucan water dikinase n=1 Tax=Rhizophora mucronata TaxID=61149 RepID=A0A2P2LZM8_RHIMU
MEPHTKYVKDSKGSLGTICKISS